MMFVHKIFKQNKAVRFVDHGLVLYLVEHQLRGVVGVVHAGGAAVV